MWFEEHIPTNRIKITLLSIFCFFLFYYYYQIVRYGYLLNLLIYFSIMSLFSYGFYISKSRIVKIAKSNKFGVEVFVLFFLLILPFGYFYDRVPQKIIPTIIAYFLLSFTSLVVSHAISARYRYWREIEGDQ